MASGGFSQAFHKRLVDLRGSLFPWSGAAETKGHGSDPMRIFLCCMGLVYGTGSIIDTTLVRPSQPATLDQTLSEAVPAWFGETTRIASTLPID